MNHSIGSGLWVAFAVVFVMGCGSSSGGGGGGAGTDPKLESFRTPQAYSMVVGTVKDASGQAMGDVDVTVAGFSTKTNDQGYFAVARLPKIDKGSVNFNKKGFVPQARPVKTQIGESSFLEVTMAPMERPWSFNAANGADVVNKGVRVVIPANALMTPDGQPYSGDVDIKITPFDPTTPEGHKVFPGRFEGVQRNGEVIPIRSLGFADITPMTQDGRPLQLRPGMNANIEIPVAINAQAGAPATLPLWYFNPNDGQWHEEGQATLAGNVYRGSIPHFSIWNCDVGYRRGWIKGRVRYCNKPDQSVRGARVTIKNVKAGWTSGEDSSPDNGEFRIPVNAGEDIEIFAEKGSSKSAVKKMTGPPDGIEDDIGVICLDVASVQIVLTWGAKPFDLDSHLTIPTPDHRSHLFFGAKQVGNAQLDTDDTNGYGPEITSVYQLHDGVYRFSVKHYGGEGNLATSQAYVHMTVEGMGIFEMNAPIEGISGLGDLWLLWDFKVSQGKVSEIIPLARVVRATEPNITKQIDP